MRRLLLSNDPPFPERGPDVPSWNVGDVVKLTYNTSITWNHLRPSAPTQNWTKAVWYKGHVPCILLAFTFWIAQLNRLPTRSRLAAWGTISTDLCCTCNIHSETRDHLLLHCEFVEQIWKIIMHRLGHPPFIFADWSFLISWMLTDSPSLSTTLKRLTVQATISMIWMERNSRLHNQVSSTVPSVFKLIDRNIRDTILARKVRRAFSNLLQDWFANE